MGSMLPFEISNGMATDISHEFMHALGFDHEQKRGDQAQNVYIHYGWFQSFFLEIILIYNHFYDLYVKTLRLKPSLRKYFSWASLCFRNNACQRMDAPWLWI